MTKHEKTALNESIDFVNEHLQAAKECLNRPKPLWYFVQVNVAKAAARANHLVRITDEVVKREKRATLGLKDFLEGVVCDAQGLLEFQDTFTPEYMRRRLARIRDNAEKAIEAYDV